MVYEKKNAGDPFAVKPLPKAHYHPSREKHLSKSQKKTAISPGKTRKAENEIERQSLVDKMFLHGSHSYQTQIPGQEDISGSSKFDESWPSSERPSTIGVGEETSPLPGADLVKKHMTLDDIKQTLRFSADKDSSHHSSGLPNDSSTLQRYLERFRKAEPKSRAERAKEGSARMKDFWWLSEGSHDHSHDISKQSAESHLTGSHVIPDSFNSKASKLGIIPPSPGDLKTRHLQERAEKLLEQSNSTVLSSDPAVSTDGLGSSPSGTTVSSFDEKPYRPQFTRGKGEIPRFDLDSATKRRVTKPARPEDDVLYQWRLKRKMETARNTAHLAPSGGGRCYLQPEREMTHTSDVEAKLEEFKARLSRLEVSGLDSPKRSAKVQFTAAPILQQEDEEYSLSSRLHEEVSQKYSETIQKQPIIASPTLSRKKNDGIDPHLHLMCDVLPCPHQDSYINRYKQEDEGVQMGLHHDDGRRETQDRLKFPHHEDFINKDSKQTDPVKDESVRNRMKGINKDELCLNRIEQLGDEQQHYKYLQAERPDIEDHTSVTKTEIGNEINKTEHETCSTEHDSDQNELNIKVVIDPARLYGNKGLVPKPRHSSSPKLGRRQQPDEAPVKDVIGQVVKDRLFNGSVSTLVSSVESLPSFSTTQQTILSSPQHETSSKTPEIHKNTTDDDKYDSDGEFPEDELLKILRQQRSQYEQKLRKIDEMLLTDNR